MLLKSLVFVLFLMRTFAAELFNLLPPDFSSHQVHHHHSSHRFRSGEIKNGEDYFFLGSSDGYSDEIIDLPQAPVAQGTTKHCGMYIQAPPNTTCQNIIKSYWVPMDIFLLANPSLVSVVQCDSNLEAGASYCLYPHPRWNSTIPDLGSIASSIGPRNIPGDVSPLHKRAIDPWGRQDRNPAQHAPTLATIIDGILAGHLSFHYARWVWASGQNSNAPEGPILEIAYWIGPRVGVEPTADEEASMNLDRYRDRRRGREGFGRNRWVVFHLHVNPETNFLQVIDGRTHLGVQRITMFHGSHPVNPRAWGYWVRVYGDDYGGENVRLAGGLSCTADRMPQTELRNRHGLWYVGWNRPYMPTDHPIFDRLYHWGLDLYHKGYAWTPGLLPILEGWRLNPSSQDIDPSSNGILLRPYQQNDVWNGNGYDTSFRIVFRDGNYSWTFNIPNPGDPPSEVAL